jgi:hypothetical protein
LDEVDVPLVHLEAVADFVHFLDDFVRPQDLTRRDPARKPLKQDLIVILGKRGGLAAYSGGLTVASSPMKARK